MPYDRSVTDRYGMSRLTIFDHTSTYHIWLSMTEAASRIVGS